MAADTAVHARVVVPVIGLCRHSTKVPIVRFLVRWKKGLIESDVIASLARRAKRAALHATRALDLSRRV